MRRLVVLIISIFCINIGLVVFFPEQPPSVSNISLPTSPMEGQIQISFSDALVPDSFTSAFQIVPPVDGNIIWTGKTVTFTPTSMLDFDMEYTISLENTAYSYQNIPLDQQYVWTFIMPKESLFVLSHDDNDYSQLKQVDLDSFETESLLDIPLIVHSFTYSQSLNTFAMLASHPDAFVAQEFGSFEVWIYEQDTNELVQLTELSDSYHYHEVHFLPFEDTLLITRSKIITSDTGNYLSFQTQHREIVLYHLITNRLKVITPGVQVAYGVYPSPDGRYIKMIDDVGSLVLWNISDDEALYLENDFDEAFGFSENGGYILYTKFGSLGPFSEGNMLVAQKFSGVQSTIVADAAAAFSHPDMSSDENLVVFEYADLSGLDADGVLSQIALAKIGDENIKVLTDRSLGAGKFPKFSPSGDVIVFAGFSEEDYVDYLDLGWDDYLQDFIRTELYVYDLKTKEIIPSGIEVSGYEWGW